MVNAVKYVNEVAAKGSPIAGERISTNGYYTGQHKGAPMQGYGEANDAYEVEYGTVRLGTITPDYLGVPKQGVGIVETLTKCTSTNKDRIVSKEDNLSITYTADDGYELPAEIVVKIGGTTATVSTDYTWSDATGKLAIAKAKLTGDLDITIVATEGA